MYVLQYLKYVVLIQSPCESGHGWEETSPATVDCHSMFHKSVLLGHSKHIYTSHASFKIRSKLQLVCDINIRTYLTCVATYI